MFPTIKTTFTRKKLLTSFTSKGNATVPKKDRMLIIPDNSIKTNPVFIIKRNCTMHYFKISIPALNFEFISERAEPLLVSSSSVKSNVLLMLSFNNSKTAITNLILVGTNQNENERIIYESTVPLDVFTKRSFKVNFECAIME